MVKTFTRAVLCTLLATLAMISSDASAAFYVPYPTAGMSASQSSAFSADVDAATAAGRAIDGNTGGDQAGWDRTLLDKDGNVVSTNDNSNLVYDKNWWIVDLGQELSIDAVKIFFEGAYSTEFKIEYFNVDPATGSASPISTTEVIDNATTAFTHVENTPVTARYVRLNFKSATNPVWGIKFYEVQFLHDIESTLGTDLLTNSKATATIFPDKDADGNSTVNGTYSNLFDGNEDSQFGWGDGKLGTSETLAEGDAYYTIDMQSLCNIKALKLKHANATITSYTLKLYTLDPDSEGTTPVFTDSYTIDGNKWQEWQNIIFESPVNNVAFARIYVTGMKTPAWGARFAEFVAYGEKVKPVAVALDIDDEPLLTDVGYKLDAVLTYSGGVTSLTSDYTVESITPAEGLTYADGEFKATVAGTYTVKIAAEGVEGEASLTFSYIGVNLLHNGGDFGTQFWFHPSQDADGETLLQGNESWLVDKSITTGAYGWKDRALGTDKTLEKGKAFFTFGMRRLCNVEVVRIHHAQSKITSFTLEFFRLNPEISENKDISPVYSIDCTNDTEDWQEIKLPETLKDVRFVRLHVTGMSHPEWGARISEIEVLGKGPNDKVYVADSYKLSRRDVPKGDYYTATVNGYDSENDVLLDEIDDKFVVIKVSDTQEEGFTGKINTHDTKGGNQPNGFIEGLERGLVNVTVSVKNDDGDVVGTFDDVIEVTTKDWSKLVNIARSYRTYAQGDNRNAVDNGMTDGNPRSRVYVGNTKGGVNEYPDGLIDGDWHAWTISTAELAQEEKPYVIVDLGAAYPVNEFNLHWNADGDGEGNGSYFLMKGDYEVYGFAGDFEGEPDSKAEGWKSLYTVKSNDPGRYDVGRHVFRTENVRYMMFRFTTAPLKASIMSSTTREMSTASTAC